MVSTTSRFPRLLTSTLPLLGALVFWYSIAETTFAAAVDGVTTTLAGNGTAGISGDGGLATLAQVNNAQGAAVDSAGNVYIADTDNQRIRKVTAATGVISTVAGTGIAGFLGDGGQATAARLYYPTSVAVDQAGNVYIADRYNQRIRKITVGTGVITTVAGSGTAGFGGDNGLATAAQLNYPYGVTLDAAGNIYIADTNNHRIRRVTAASGIITTVAGTGTAGYNGDGLATTAQLYSPEGVAVDGTANVYIADTNNQRIRKVTAATGVISTVAGTGAAGFSGEGGLATAAQVHSPIGVAIDGAGNVYFADYYNQRIRKLTLATGVLATVAGSGTIGFEGDGGLGTAAALGYPTGVAVDAAGAMYIADSLDYRIRKVAAPTVPTLLVTTVAGTGTAGYNGDGLATTAQLYSPQGVTVDGAGNVYIADTNNQRVRKVTAATGVISTVAGTGVAGFSGEGGLATAAQVHSPTGMAVDAAGNVYLADYYNQRIRKITVATGLITTVAGTGVPGFSGDGGAATAAELQYPTGVAVDAAGNIYIPDQYNQRIRKVTAATGVITTIAGNGVIGVAGDGGLATAAQLNYPQGVGVDGAGNVYIADTNNQRMRKVTAATGLITTFAGTGTAGYTGETVAATSAQLYNPTDVAVDAGGNVYLVDRYNQRVRKITAGTGVIATVVGSANLGFGGDGGVASAAQLNYPNGLAVDGVGNVYIADTNGQRVRKAGVPTVPATTLIAPSGIIESATPTYTWNKVSAATWYYLWVEDPSGTPVIQTWYPASVCGATTCSVTPAVPVSGGTYKWWVQTWNSNGYGPWSSPLSFVPGFAATTLIAPSGTAGTTTPTYSWNKTGASWYYLWVQVTSSATPVIQTWYTAASVCPAAGGICAVTPAFAVTAGTTYQWWVETYYDAGGYGPWSSSLNFVAGAPPATGLISPSGSIGTQTPTYTWGKVPSSTWYYLWVQNAGGTPVMQTWYTAASVCGTLTCSVTPAVTLAVGNTHTWWVETWNPLAYGPWSTSLSVTPTAPTATTLTSPTGSVATTTPTYVWNKVPSSTWYYLWVQNAGGTPVVQTWYTSDSVCGSGVCSVTPSVALASGNLHTWWVETWNPIAYGPWSTGLTFTPTATIPGAATLVSPANGSTETSPGVTFQWNKVTAATWYYLWLDSASTGGVVRQWYTGPSVCGISLCSLPIPANLPSGSYSWWIQPWSPAGYGPWSTGFTFTVASAPTSIVLTWNEYPSDLDAHLLTPQIGGLNYHVYYSNPGSTTSPPYALLEHDRQTGFGAENIDVAQRFPGTYRYFVQNLSGTPPLAGSGAQVKIYLYDTLLTTLTAPATGTGDYWQVCDINGATGALAACPNVIGDLAPAAASLLNLDLGAASKSKPAADDTAAKENR